jgi:hypothetical protein
MLSKNYLYIYGLLQVTTYLATRVITGSNYVTVISFRSFVDLASKKNLKTPKSLISLKKKNLQIVVLVYQHVDKFLSTPVTWLSMTYQPFINPMGLGRSAISGRSAMSVRDSRRRDHAHTAT